MGVAVLHPQDFLKGPFARNTFVSHMKYPRSPNSCPNKTKKPLPNNRRRRTQTRPQAGNSPPPAPSPPETTAVSPKGLKKATHKNSNSTNHHMVVGQVRILKRGQETSDSVAEDSDLESSRKIGTDLEMMPMQIRISDTPASFYAGPVTLTSPPPSDVPLPAFCTKKSVSMFKADDATNNLIRILRLEI